MFATIYRPITTAKQYSTLLQPCKEKLDLFNSKFKTSLGIRVQHNLICNVDYFINVFIETRDQVRLGGVVNVIVHLSEAVSYRR